MCLDLKYCNNKKGRIVSQENPIIGYKKMILNSNGELLPFYADCNKQGYILNKEYEAKPEGEVKNKLALKRQDDGAILLYSFIDEGFFHYYQEKNNASLVTRLFAYNDFDILVNGLAVVKCAFWGQTYEEDIFNVEKHLESCSKYMKILEIVKTSR